MDHRFDIRVKMYSLSKLPTQAVLKLKLLNQPEWHLKPDLKKYQITTS